jgi:hypothetical protein
MRQLVANASAACRVVIATRRHRHGHVVDDEQFCSRRPHHFLKVRAGLADTENGLSWRRLSDKNSGAYMSAGVSGAYEDPGTPGLTMIEGSADRFRRV